MKEIKQYEGLDKTVTNKLRDELIALDREMVEIGGMKLKPSQCYRLGIDPPHVLFNTNCPDEIKDKVKAIMSKYIPNAEAGAS